MANTQYALNWDAFQSSMCSGFSSFQQNGEFVDMTLAADGHMVKVHQIVMALASPFLKELINNAQCPHPVIYLNNVKHATLCNILEYIYTGEVLIDANHFSEFILTAKGLHIRGLDTVSGEDSTESARVQQPLVAGTKRTAAQTNVLSELPDKAKRIFVKNEKSGTLKGEGNDLFSFEETVLAPQDESWSGGGDSGAKDVAPSVTSANLQFTVSNRGQLQVILNRYLYSLHSTAHHAGQRRWRCVDYRNLRCPAYLVTKGSLVLSRSNLHNHTFHDKKILSKIERNCVFAAMEDVKGVKSSKKSDADTTADDDETFGE